MSSSETHEGTMAGRVNVAAAAETAQEPLAGTGGSSGGGTLAGAGDPLGGRADLAAGDRLTAMENAPDREHSSDEEIAHDAAALGPAVGSLADAAGLDFWAAAPGPVGAESLASGAGSGGVGWGTPTDRGDLGEGDPPGGRWA